MNNGTALERTLFIRTTVFLKGVSRKLILSEKKEIFSKAFSFKHINIHGVVQKYSLINPSPYT